MPGADTGRCGKSRAASLIDSLIRLRSKSAVMTSAKIIEEIGARISDAIASSPARDIDKNVRALLNSTLGRLDLVTREEFDVQTQVLLRTREKLEAMTLRVAELEARLGKRDSNI